MTKCWAHRRRVAVACGTFTRRGYCRRCWPETAALPVNGLTAREKAYWPNRPPVLQDWAIWLAALVSGGTP